MAAALPSIEKSRSRFLWAGAALVGALALVIGWTWYGSRPIAPQAQRSELTQFTWPLPPGMRLGSAPVVAPDGTRVAFVGADASGSRLYVRERGAAAAVAVAATDGAMHPFWSADGASLGFFAGGRLQKVSLPGGVPVPLATALFPFGGSWNTLGTIVFAPDVIMTGVQRIAAMGGDPAPATLLDTSLGDTSHAWPVFLPDGTHFLYFVRSARDDRRGVYVGRIDEPPAAGAVPLLRSDSNATYVSWPGTAEGVLLYVVNGRVEVRRFDPRTLTFDGDPVTIDGVSATGTSITQPAMVSASADVLVVATGTVPYGNRLEAVTRAGERLQLWEPAEAQNWPRISPNGRYLARQRVDALANTPDIWVGDLARGTEIRVTTALEPDLRQTWSADSRYLAYVTGSLPGRPGKRMLQIAAADGTGVLRTLPCPGAYCEPTDWSTIGLLVNVIDGARQDVWIVPADGAAAAQPLLAEAFPERDAQLSPDGRWVAYVSEESGRPEVLIRTIAGVPERIAVSASGGDHPTWRRDGRELFFVDPNGQLQSVPVVWSRGRPSLGLPVKMNVPPIGRGHWGTPYDVSPDGERIYFLRRNDDAAPNEMHVVIGWRALLR
jgi:Tol biopolymer transport system component